MQTDSKRIRGNAAAIRSWTFCWPDTNICRALRVFRAYKTDCQEIAFFLRAQSDIAYWVASYYLPSSGRIGCLLVQIFSPEASKSCRIYLEAKNHGIIISYQWDFHDYQDYVGKLIIQHRTNRIPSRNPAITDIRPISRICWYTWRRRRVCASSSLFPCCQFCSCFLAVRQRRLRRRGTHGCSIVRQQLQRIRSTVRVSQSCRPQVLCMIQRRRYIEKPSRGSSIRLWANIQMGRAFYHWMLCKAASTKMGSGMISSSCTLSMK